MNPELLNDLRKLRNEIAHGMSPVNPSALAERLKSLGISIPIEQLPEFLPTLLQNFGAHAGHLHIPAVLGEVVPSLLKGRSARIICDPWAGLGGFLALAETATAAERAIAVNRNSAEADLGKVLYPTADWHKGAPLAVLKSLTEPLSIVVGNLPFNAESNEAIVIPGTDGSPIELRYNLDQLILAEATARLADDGIGLFIVPPSLFNLDRSVLGRFPDLGFAIEAAFALPPGSFTPYTSITTYLVVVRKGAVDRTFVAQLSNDQNTNGQILTNFRKREEGGATELGRFVSILHFRGIDALRADEYFAAASKHIGFPAVSLELLATAINLGRFGDNFNFPTAENAIYVPLIGHSDVIDSVAELSLKAQNYAQVVIDPTRSQALFVAQFFNSELGKKIREWNKSGTTILKLNKRTLSKLQVFIPDLATQGQILETEARLATEENTLKSLQNELLEIRRDLWKNPQNASAVGKRISSFATRISGNLKQQASASLGQWFETIPFPLASILRAWQATPSDDYKTKQEHLLHFFEATAEFISVILLSAFSANETLYSPHKEKLAELMKKQNLSFQRASFGTWKAVVEYLGKQTRQLLQEAGKKPEDSANDRAICEALFADSSLMLPLRISDKGIAAVLGVTNKWRNDWPGHGGVVSQGEAKLRNELLLGELLKLREAMGDVWEDSILVNALQCRPKKGVFENEIAILKGSNSEFLKESRPMSTFLYVDSLYVINGEQRSALKLLPLVRVGSSPESAKNACYFFNRMESEKARFVSYHFADKPELLGIFEDAAEAIKFLTVT